MSTDFSQCASICKKNNCNCINKSCKYWINYNDDNNCTLIAVENHPQGMTLEEISLRFGCTRERIRQIEEKALENFKKSLNRLITDKGDLNNLLENGHKFVKGMFPSCFFGNQIIRSKSFMIDSDGCNIIRPYIKENK